MKTTRSLLALLPPETLSLITQNLDAEPLLRLYATGDSFLRQKLHHGGVTHFMSKDEPYLPPREIPLPLRDSTLRRSVHRSLYRFSKLTHLSLHYFDGDHPLRAPTCEDLAVYGKMLVSIDIQMWDVFRILLNPEYHPQVSSREFVGSAYYRTDPFTELLTKLVFGDRQLPKQTSLIAAFPEHPYTNPWANFAELTPSLRTFVAIRPYQYYSSYPRSDDIGPYITLLMLSFPRTLQHFECNLFAGLPLAAFDAMIGATKAPTPELDLGPFDSLLTFHTFAPTHSVSQVGSPGTTIMDLTSIQRLPKTLTSLSTAQPITASSLRHFPNLLRLTLPACSMDTIEALPRSLEHFSTSMRDHIPNNFISLLPRGLRLLNIQHSTLMHIEQLQHLPPTLTSLRLKGLAGSALDVRVSLHNCVPPQLRDLSITEMPQAEIELDRLPATLEALKLPSVQKFEFRHYEKFRSLTRLDCAFSTITEEAIFKAPPRMRFITFYRSEAQGYAMMELANSEQKNPPDLLVSRVGMMNALQSWVHQRRNTTAIPKVNINFYLSGDLHKCPAYKTSIAPSINCSAIPPSQLPPFLMNLPSPYTIKLEDIPALPQTLAHMKHIDVAVTSEQAVRLAAFLPHDLNTYIHSRTLVPHLLRLPEAGPPRSTQNPLLIDPFIKVKMTPSLIAALPSTLTSISFQDDHNLSDDVIAVMPATITHMTLNGEKDTFNLLRGLALGRHLQQLEHLAIPIPSTQDVLLPRCLFPSTTTEFPNVPQTVLGFGVLPRGLKTLVYGKAINSFITVPDEAWLDLPSSLTELRIGFPTGVQDSAVPFFPPNLVTLHINSFTLTPACKELLPPKLEKFTLAKRAVLKPFTVYLANRAKLQASSATAAPSS